MKYLYGFLLVIIFISFSCERDKNTTEVSEVVDTLAVDDDRIINNISETLIPEAKQTLKDWKEYKKCR